MKLPDYHTATNAAYELLSRLPKYTPSVDVFYIAENLLDDCKVLSYGQACFCYPVTRELLLENSTYGFTIKNGQRRIILYNETMPLPCIRFTLAHEIGHAILGHSGSESKAMEKEANCFARNLLCPFVVAQIAGACIPADYVDLFTVSLQMATVSINSIGRDRYHISSENQSKMEELYVAYLMGFDNLDAYYHYLVS